MVKLLKEKDELGNYEIEDIRKDGEDEEEEDINKKIEDGELQEIEDINE